MKSENSTPLTAVIVTALSDEAYGKACSEHSVMDALLFDNQPILRERDILLYTETSTSHDIKNDTLKYRLELLEPVSQGHALPDATRVILLSSQGDFAFSTSSDPDSADSMNDTQDSIEIDEDFLGSSILNLNLESPREHNTHTFDSNQDAGEPSWSGYIPKSLSAPVDSLQDDCTFYVRTADLGKLGILSGDWVRDFNFGKKQRFK